MWPAAVSWFLIRLDAAFAARWYKATVIQTKQNKSADNRGGTWKNRGIGNQRWIQRRVIRWNVEPPQQQRNQAATTEAVRCYFSWVLSLYGSDTGILVHPHLSSSASNRLTPGSSCSLCFLCYGRVDPVDRPYTRSAFVIRDSFVPARNKRGKLPQDISLSCLFVCQLNRKAFRDTDFVGWIRC